MNNRTLRDKCEGWLMVNTIINYTSEEATIDSLVKFVNSILNQTDEPEMKIGDYIIKVYDTYNTSEDLKND